MMMGIGNLTELTDADSAGVNVVLLGFCQELGIRSVLTTQVINWARSSVRECDLARRLVYHSVRHRVLPKHLEPRLVMLRDADVTRSSPPTNSTGLPHEIKDANYRVFAPAAKCTSLAAACTCTTPIRSCCSSSCGTAAPTAHCPRIWTRPRVLPGLRNVQGGDGACTLGKQYEQDEPLDWGFLTQDATSTRIT